MFAVIIILAGSIGALTAGIIIWQKGNLLLTTGRKAEAIILKNIYKPGTDIEFDAYYPVVRFLTDKQEWIVQELNIGYSPAKKEGTKLEVIYDPTDPTNVAINSTLQLHILPRLLVIIGSCGTLFGVLELLGITQLFIV